MGYLTYKEKSLLFSALTREEKVCKDNGFDNLIPVVKSLERKFYYDRFEKEIRNKAIDEMVDGIREILECNAIYNIDCISTLAEQMKGGAK